MRRPSIIPKHEDSNGWWETLLPPTKANVLRETHHVQTAIIGAGICGLSVAHQLSKQCPNDDIAVIEAERAGNNASGRNAGFMLNVHSHGPPKKIDVLRRNMKLWLSGLEDLRRMVREFQIDCDWDEYGRLYGSAGPDGEIHIAEIAETLDQLELEHSWFSREEMQSKIGTSFYKRGLHTPGSALVNPAALMRGLARNLPASVQLFEESPVLGIERSGGGFLIETAEGSMRADRVVLAAGVFLPQFGVAKNRFVSMATYASLTAPLTDDELSQMGSAESFGLLGSSEYGSTIRLTKDRRLFIRNVFEFAPGAPTSNANVVDISSMHRKAMQVRWPGLAETKFEHSWGGQMAFTNNNGTVFGEVETGLYAILTNDVSPMTRGTAAGRLLADFMTGQDSDLLSVQMSIPKASRLPPRPILDIGVAARRGLLRLAARKEF